LFERTAGADVIGGFVDQAVEDGVAGQFEEEVDAVFFRTRPSPVGDCNGHRRGS
jgi:hypothetical protein